MSDNVKKLVNDAYVCDENGKEIEHLEIESISVNPTSNLINAPVEGGTKSFDHKVREPISISVKAYVTSEYFATVCAKLREYYETNEWKFCNVITKEKVYPNMSLQNMPHEETAEKYDVLYFTLTFLEIMSSEVAEQSAESADAADSGTQNMGRAWVS